jgi:hypothetical protein
VGDAYVVICDGQAVEWRVLERGKGLSHVAALMLAKAFDEAGYQPSKLDPLTYHLGGLGRDISQVREATRHLSYDLHTPPYLRSEG